MPIIQWGPFVSLQPPFTPVLGNKVRPSQLFQTDLISLDRIGAHRSVGYCLTGCPAYSLTGPRAKVEVAVPR